MFYYLSSKNHCSDFRFDHHSVLKDDIVALFKIDCCTTPVELPLKVFNQSKYGNLEKLTNTQF